MTKFGLAYLFLEFSDGKGRRYAQGYGKDARKQEWEWLLQRLFEEGKSLSALDACIETVKKEKSVKKPFFSAILKLMHYIRTKLFLRPVHSIYSALINQRQILYGIFSKCSFQTIAYTLGITKLSQIGKMDSIDRRLIIIAYQSLRRDVIYIFLLFFLQLLILSIAVLTEKS